MNKQDLLNKLRQAAPQAEPMPDMSLIRSVRYDDPVEQFVKMCGVQGASLVRIASTDEADAAIAAAYPNAGTLATNLPYIHASQQQYIKNPDTLEAGELDGTDVGIVEGRIGVAENGCVWIPQTMREKAMLFISEQIVIILHASDIVNSMHDAYARLAEHRPEDNDERYNFGTFIAGPSKTADIEQALVMGAQAARAVTVLLIG